MAKCAIITGSNGFIGRHLWDMLSDRGIEPIALDRHDLYIEVPQLTEILFHHKPSYIFLLHAYGNHRKQTDVTQSIMANYFATYNVLKASEFLDYEALINVGSSSCYGIQGSVMTEDTAMKPDTFYAATKAGAMHLARSFAKQYDKPVANVIPFSVYGEGEASFRFIPNVIHHLVTQESIRINKEQMHDWIYVRDFIDGMLTVVDNIQELKGESINIGTGMQATNSDVVGMLEMISDKKLSISGDYDKSPFDSPRWQSDSSKIRAFGWKDKTRLRDGLVKCWDYYSKLYA